MEEAEAGLVTAEVLAVWRWWLEERWLVLEIWLMCLSAGNSSEIEDF